MARNRELINATFGKYLREMRLKRGVRIDTLARRLCRDANYIESLELGEESVELDQFIELMGVMRINPIKGLREVLETLQKARCEADASGCQP